jgi:hypothetical protein
MKTRKSQHTVFGYVKNRGKIVPFGVPTKDVQNTFLFGKIKSGKSTILKKMMQQDIRDEIGFFFLDPHRQTAMDVVSMIPEHLRHRIVYFSLAAPREFNGMCNRINPFEYENDQDRFDVVASFVSMLAHHYTNDGKIGWGPRLEMIIRHITHLLVSVPNSKLQDMGKILIDEKTRKYFMSFCTFQPTLDFFESDQFEKLSDDATMAVANKIDELLSTPAVTMFLDAAKSTITIKEMIDQGKFVIMDLLGGSTEPITELIGSVMLHMFNVEGKKRQQMGIYHNVPFNIYVDECHMFAGTVLRELSNTVRKFGMHLTLATQTVDKLSKEFAGDITSLNQIIVSFSSSSETEKLLAKTFAMDPKTITGLSKHMFILWADTNPPIRGRAMTKPMPSVRFEDIKPIIAKSLETASKVNLDLYMPPLRHRQGMGPTLSPLEFFLLNTLYLEMRDMTRDELIAATLSKFDVSPRKISEALFTKLENLRYVTQTIPQADDGDKNNSMRLAITSLALDTLYSKSIAGRRGGSALHVSTQLNIMNIQHKNYNYCILDTAEHNTEKADLTVFSFKTIDSTEPITIYTKFDPDFWSDSILAIEVETEPSKHPPTEKNPISQVYKNFTKNKKNHYDVCFVTFSVISAEKIREILAHYSIGREEYQIMLVSPSVRMPKHIDSITPEEEKIIRTLDDVPGSTAKRIIAASKLNPVEAIAAINSLEHKEILERSGVGKNNSKLTWIKKQDLTKPANQKNNSEYSDTDSNQLLLLINEDQYNTKAKEELEKRGFKIKRKPSGGFSISKK